MKPCEDACIWMQLVVTKSKPQQATGVLTVNADDIRRPFLENSDELCLEPQGVIRRAL